jgi:quinolinate synthase
VMEYVAAGDVAADDTYFLSTEGMMRHARESDKDTMIVATETGILHRMEIQSPGTRFIPANRSAVCKYMKMITLPKLRDALRELKPEVRVDPEIAKRARVPIERMVTIS